MAAATTVRFTSGLASATINGPSSPTKVECLPQWASSLSQGLQRWTYRGTDRYVEHWTLSFESLITSQWVALRNFFYNTVKGPENSFTYLHTDGESYTARFVNTDLTAQRLDANSWATELKLELLGQQVNGSSTSTTSTTTTSTTTTTTTTAGGGP